MQRRSKRLIFASLLVIVIAAIIWQSTRTKPIAVTVAKVERARVEATVANTRAGTVKTCQRARLAPTMGGQVAKLLVKKGDKVTKGQPLMEFWNDDLKARLRLAESDARSAKAQSDEACIRAGIASRNYERNAQLHKQHLISDEALDSAKSNKEASAAACTAAKANVQVRNDQVAVARAQLSRTIITAPFSGVVAEITGEPGEYVTPSPPGIPTPPAVDLIDPDCLYVSAPIDEVDAPRVQLKMKARITLDAFGKKHFDGEVQRIAPYVLDVEKQARTVEVEVYFNHSEQLTNLLPGYSADVEIILDAHDDTLRVPTESVLEGDKVLLYDANNSTLVERAVKTGLSNWQYTEITEGLKAGDEVVTSVQREGVKAGAQVTLEANSP